MQFTYKIAVSIQMNLDENMANQKQRNRTSGLVWHHHSNEWYNGQSNHKSCLHYIKILPSIEFEIMTFLGITARKAAESD